MRESKKGVLVLDLTVAALCAPVNSSFAQGHTRMSGPPQPPKTTTTPTGTWLPKSIAYIKASNTRKDNQFGSAIALSADGNLLAVGSSGEASSAIGINGNQSDRSMPGAGAVYVFARAGAAWSQQAYLKSSNTGGPDVGYQFGYAVSLSSDGSTLAVSMIVTAPSPSGRRIQQSDL